ncbi:MAG: hypothetical protein KDB02_03170 [Acidimicrobiales bacterium]|nr:hypothetical protein [Acidimicrobiales bacterium]
MSRSPVTRTEVRAGQASPVVVRVALDDDGRELVAQEADRLRRARHPGVVELTAVRDDEIELAWAGAETLATAKLELGAAAAVLAAVAGTVADLHGIGLVHGRLDPSHVVVGADGWPRLCGMRGPLPGERPVGPAEDVKALGELVEHVVGMDTEMEPIPDRRWGKRKWSGYQRRALQAVADAATDPDPARRPTARVLARSISEAVPQSVEHVTPPPPRAEHPPTIPERSSAPQPVEQPEKAHDGEPATSRRSELPPLPKLPKLRPAAAPDTFAPPPPSPGPGSAPSVSEAPPPGLRRSSRSNRRRSPDARAAALLVAAAAAVAAALIIWPTTTANEPQVSATSATFPVSTTDAATTIPPTIPPTVPSACVPTGKTAAEQADLDGDGCPEPYRIQRTTVRALGRTYEAGQPGDVVAVGDWDCDGTSTIAVLRPSSGEVFLFDSWDVTSGPITVRASDAVPGARSLRPGNGPTCVPVTVDARGVETPIDLRGGSR